jgi:hypothetical protein
MPFRGQNEIIDHHLSSNGLAKFVWLAGLICLDSRNSKQTFNMLI